MIGNNRRATSASAFRAAAAFLVFGFLATMAATGALAGVDSTKARGFAWLVEAMLVGSLGRAGATAALLMLGLCAGVIAYNWKNSAGARR